PIPTYLFPLSLHDALPISVISDDYWARRFGRDPKVVGRTFRMGADLYQIVGVIDGPFSGTQTGTMTAMFVPTMMNPKVLRNNALDRKSTRLNSSHRTISYA